MGVATVAVLIFAPTALLCGIYLDDYSFLRMLEGAPASGLWNEFLNYVPGRNLHIPLFYALIRLTGGSVAGMHAVSVAFEALNAGLVFIFIRRLSGLRSIAWAAALIFIAAPNHGETHFWVTLIPQCHVPLALTLGAFLFALDGARLAPAIALYALALFTYDQVFFLWPLLLVAAWRSDPSPVRARYAAAGTLLLGLNAAHITLRYVSPYASGGRPLIRIADFFPRLRDAFVAVAKGIIPLQTPSYAHWGWSVLAAAAALAAGLWIVRVATMGVRAEKRGLALWIRDGGWIGTLVFGSAWAALAYVPNLFWYLSPRHNLIPSVGWAAALAAAGAFAASRSARAAAALPFAAGIFFALAVLANVHEGTQWIASRRLRESFAAGVMRLTPPVDTLFLTGAPRYLHRAPAFNLPHDVMFAAARELGRDVIGDYQAAPTRRGILYYNDLSISPPSLVRWIPAEDVNLLSYDKDSGTFECAASLSVEEPSGARRGLPLRQNRGCSASVSVPAEVVLLESRVLPAPAERPVGDISLSRAEIRLKDRTTEIELDWAMRVPPAKALGIVPRFFDSEGVVLLDAVFPYPGTPAARDFFLEQFLRDRNPVRPYPRIWPLVDEEAARAAMRPGQVLRQVFELRKTMPGRMVEGTLEVELFEYEPAGPARSLGLFSVPVTARSSS